MKSFGGIVFLAFLVLISCAFAGSVKEGTTSNLADCHRISVNKLSSCPHRCPGKTTQHVRNINPRCSSDGSICPQNHKPYLCGPIPQN